MFGSYKLSKAIPAAIDAVNIPKLMKVTLSDVIVDRNFGICSITKLPRAVDDIPANQKRRAFNPQDIAKLGINVNVNVSKDAVKPVIDPKMFSTYPFTNKPATTPPADDRMLPTKIIMDPIDMVMAN